MNFLFQQNLSRHLYLENYLFRIVYVFIQKLMFFYTH